MADTGLRFGTFALSNCMYWLTLKAVKVSVLHQFMQKMKVKNCDKQKSHQLWTAFLLWFIYKNFKISLAELVSKDKCTQKPNNFYPCTAHGKTKPNNQLFNDWFLSNFIQDILHELKVFDNFHMVPSPIS